MKVELLDNQTAEEYERFVLRDENAFIRVSDSFRKLLKEVVGGRDIYLIARDQGGEIQGVLPAFHLENAEYGGIINSLPLFGSNGGVIEHTGNERVYKILLNELDAYAREKNCAAATIISSPFADQGMYERHFPHEYEDYRISLITRLNGPGDPEERILERISETRRRNIRKARKSGLTVERGVSDEKMAFLMEAHEWNMAAKSGIPRPRSYFSALAKHLRPDVDFRLYTAFLDQRPVAALLSYFYNRTVNYGVPVFLEEVASLQPVSLLIFEAMVEAAREGFLVWNWGGTWAEQKGVYDFKKKWATEEFRYFYYVREYDLSGYRNLSPDEIRNQAPYFYVLPYNCCKVCHESA